MRNGNAKIHIDYHFVFDDHYYSVPYKYLHCEVKVRALSQLLIQIALKRKYNIGYSKYVKMIMTQHMQLFNSLCKVNMDLAMTNWPNLLNLMIGKMVPYIVSGFFLSIRYTALLCLISTCLIPLIFLVFFTSVLFIQFPLFQYLSYMVFNHLPRDLNLFVKKVALVIFAIGYITTLIEQIYNKKIFIQEWRYKHWFWILTLFNSILFIAMLIVFVRVPNTNNSPLSNVIIFTGVFLGFYLLSLINIRIILIIDKMTLALATKLQL